MPKATFVRPDGERVEVEVETGESLMKAATRLGIQGIDGECGGAMTCTTCHVVVETPFLSEVPGLSATEDEMLAFTAMERQANSRLSCQLVMNEKMDGIVVRIADHQS